MFEPRLMLATVLNGWARNTHGSLRQQLASSLLVCARERERMINWLPSRSTSAPPPDGHVARHQHGDVIHVIADVGQFERVHFHDHLPGRSRRWC